MYNKILKLAEDFKNKVAQQVSQENIDDEVRFIKSLVSNLPLENVVNDYVQSVTAQEQKKPEDQQDYSKYNTQDIFVGLKFSPNGSPIYVGLERYPLLNQSFSKAVSPFIISKLKEKKITNPQKFNGVLNNWVNLTGLNF